MQNIITLFFKMIKYIFLYGSSVYKSTSSLSDVDVIVVSDNKDDEWNPLFSSKIAKMLGIDEVPRLDVSNYSLEEFVEGINNHEISFLECLFLPPSLVVFSNGNMPEINIDLPKLRESISRKSSNSWVKAKKKLVVGEDYNEYIAKKSLFHSLRILMFGQQIAEHKKIVNYSVANDYWEDIKNMPPDWSALDLKYKAIFNAESSKFKLLAPKSCNFKIGDK